MKKFTSVLTKILGVFLIILMSAMVLDVSWQVFTRFILKDPSSFTEELAGFLLIWIGLLGASYAYYTRAHLGIDILINKLSGLNRRIAEIAVYTIVLLFSLFIPLVGGFRLVNLTFTLKQISPALGISMGYVYLVLPLTGILMIYYSIYFISVALSGGKINSEESHIRSVE
jgi:TRAP-type C4-dicarboxylate transport system permease small subunit